MNPQQAFVAVGQVCDSRQRRNFPAADTGREAQAIVAFTALLASIGAAGIPHAGTVMMIVVLRAVNLPVDYVGLILAVDRVLDMYRTSINVWSD